MYNYEHETHVIRDRFLRNYIYYDYFHDSLITNISIQDEGKVVYLDLSCEREWPSHSWSKYACDENYMYRMSFLNCAYLEYKRTDLGIYAEYINGRFKVSEKLREICKHSRKNYLHLRIQLNDGYIDIIFNKFLIEKRTGSIELPKRISTEWHFDYSKSKLSTKEINEVRGIAISGEFPRRWYALEYLWIMNDEKIYNLALNALEDEDACIPAIFILGEIGNTDCLKNLCKMHNDNQSSYIFKRHISDAIEKIQARCY